MRIKIKTLATMIEEETGHKAEVKNVWIDFGARISGENIIIDNKYQLLTPNQLELIELGLLVSEAEEIVNKIKSRGW